MDLKDKKKIVKIVGAAETAVAKLEESIHSTQAQGKTPAKSDTQLYKSITRALDLLKSKPFAGNNIPKFCSAASAPAKIFRHQISILQLNPEMLWNMTHQEPSL